VTIRSFVHRSGRMSAAQQHALAQWLPRFGLHKAMIDWQTAFGRQAMRCVEIGCGMGDTLADSALAHPERDYLGIEVYPPGVGHLLQRLVTEQIGNVRILQADATVVLREYIPPASVDQVWLFFPDPWPKKKHHKRRIVQLPFVYDVANALKPGGLFALATDWQAYAESMVAVLESCPLLNNAYSPGAFAPDATARLQTKFERRGLQLGHGIWDLRYLRNNAPVEITIV